MRAGGDGRFLGCSGVRASRGFVGRPRRASRRSSSSSRAGVTGTPSGKTRYTPARPSLAVATRSTSPFATRPVMIVETRFSETPTHATSRR
ncbi:hypothetical protein ACFPK5_28830 [Streptomyces beijiangensis]|uniref:hypothetical protein n=1 Tax=Streptomyces beijiangensis TaxID=163361 RepID=UPI0031D82F23